MYLGAIGSVAALLLLLAVGVVIRRRGLKQERERIRISIEELNRKISRGESVTIVDLRHPLEVLAAPQVIPGAIPVSPGDLDHRVVDIHRNADVVLYCTCPSEETSLKAYRQMKDRGFRRVKVLTGGLPAWKKASLPLQQLYQDLDRQRWRRSNAAGW